MSTPTLPSYSHVYSGKVRDQYAPDDAPGDLLLLVASDRISAFDYILDTPIPDKGAVLTQLSRPGSTRRPSSSVRASSGRRASTPAAADGA